MLAFNINHKTIHIIEALAGESVELDDWKLFIYYPDSEEYETIHYEEFQQRYPNATQHRTYFYVDTEVK